MTHNTPKNPRLPSDLIPGIVAAAQQLNDPLETRRLEWTMSHVCREYRHAVINDSSLWTRVYIDLSRDGSVEISKLYFDRSVARDLRVALCAPCDIKARDLRTLFPGVIERVSSLTIEIGSHQALDTILAPFRDFTAVAPSLVQLDIRNVCAEPQTDLAIDLFSLDAPITSLSLTHCVPVGESPRWIDKLTHLEIHDCVALHDAADDFTIFHFLTGLPALTHLYLEWASAIPYKYRGMGFISSSLTHLCVEFYGEEEYVVWETLSRFSIEGVRHLVVHGSHGDQVATLFDVDQDIDPDDEDPDYSFVWCPSLTSLTFANFLNPPDCECATKNREYHQIRRPPLKGFSALKSLALLKQCFTADIISDLLGMGSKPWSNLETLTVWPLADDVEAVYKVLKEVVCWKRSRLEAVPTFVLSVELFEREYWAENRVDVELLDSIEEYMP